LVSKVAVDVQGVWKFYGDLPAVRDLSFKVFEGETFGLIGPNGAGKTTTVRILTCLIKPSRGTARVAGYDILRQSYEVKRVTGLLPESPGLYEKLSAYEFLEFVGRLYDVDHGVLEERINSVLKFFGLSDRADDLLEGYSRGMKQKVLLAATLIHDPKVVFLDEPTSGLDPASARAVKDLIKKLSREFNKTVFLCTHILSVAEELCDRVGVIDGGRLVAVDTPKKLVEETESSSLEEAFIKLTGSGSVGGGFEL